MKVYISTIAKNESQYIREFVEHHLSIGFDSIIIYDNNELDGERYNELLSAEISAGRVEIVDARGKKNY